MLHSRFSKQETSMVVRLSPEGTPAENCGALIKEVTAAVAEAHQAGKSLSLLVYFDPGLAVPESEWRSQIAKMSSTPTFRPTVAIVSKNLFWRSVVVAISFLRRPAFKEAVFSDAGEGLRWLESQSGSLPELRGALTAWGLIGGRAEARS